MSASIARLYRYPVKGLTAEPLDEAALAPGAALPGDRRLAILRAGTDYDTARPEWRPKTEFHMLMRDEALARLKARYDGARLTLEDGGREAFAGALDDQRDRARLGAVLGETLGLAPENAPRLVEAPGHSFSDHRAPVLSIIGLASIAALEKAMDAALDPLRFRANLYVAGTQAFDEFSWVGRRVAVGEAELEITARIDRCAATNVDPETASRDVNVPKALMRAFGHVDMGVYGRVERGGRIAPGDAIAPI